MARKRNTGGNAQQRVAASTAKRIPSTRQEIVEDLRSVAAGGKPGGNRINEAYAAYRARKEQEQPERAMDEAVDAWVQWNQARARTPQYRMAQDEAAEREASGYVSPENYAASIRANQRAAGRIRAGGVVMSDGRYHVGKRAQEELDRLAQSTARSELAMRAQEDETAMFRGSDYWLQRANELEQKRKASRSGYGGMMQGGTAFRETPEFTEQDRQDWDKAREYYYQVKNAERWGSMPEDLRQKALEAAGYTTDSVLAWQDGDEAALAGMTPDQRAQIQRDQRARRNQIAAILAGAGYEPEEVIEYASRVRNAERMQQEMAGLSEDVTGRGAEGVARGVYGTVQSYATNLLSPIGSVGLLAQKLFRGGAGAEQYRPVDYNTPSMYYSQATSTIRGAVGGQMGDVGRFLYDTVNSAVDSGVRMLVGQALGGGGIKPSPDMTEEAAAKLNRFVSGFISTQMSGEVFANSFVQAKENGSTDADALLDSVTSALIEGLTEKYSVESILRNPNGLTWTALRNSFLAEGSEEMASDFLNTIYDELKNGDESELRTQYRELLASGATEDDAFSRVFGDYVKQVVLDGLAGGLSGIAMSGVAEYATNKRYEKAYADPADTQALLDEARAVNPDSKLLKRAEQRVAKGKGVTGYQARELMGRNEEKLAPLKQASAKYGKQSGAMQATYQEGQDVAQYDMSYRVAYEMGKAGTKLSAAQTSTATDYLTDAQKQAAWSAGRDARTRLSDVSEVANGRALLNGQIAEVQTVSAQNGKLMAEVRQGESVQTVALDSLKVDAGTRTLAEGAKQYGSAAGTVFEQYKAGQDVAAYLRAADMAAAVGMASPSASSETVLKNLQAGQLGKALSGEQITAIYKAGQTAGRAQLRKTGMTRLGTGTVTFEQTAKGAKLNARQKASVQFIRDLAKVTGIDFTIYKSSADSTGRLQGANGAYRDGTVHVDLNAGAAYEGKLESASMLRTVSHELTHYMAEAASTEFSALQDFMVQRLSQWEGHSIQDLAEGKMATAEQAGHPITAQEALEEVVADGCEMMLRDSKAVQQLAEENRTLFEKVRDWMKKFFESLRKAFEGVEAVHPESIHMMENYAGELQKLWDEAFTAAVKNAKTANVDGVAEVERFSMRAPVEETRDLIAVHNLTEENLESSLNLGGLPSPSIAIIKAEQGHSKYGPISIVFDKSTIDPQADSRNKIYGSDAWTPTVPRVEYQVNSKRAGDLEYELNSLAKQTAGGIFSSASALRSLGIDDASSLNRQQLAEKLADNDTVRAAYLADQGKTLDPERMVKQFNRYGNEALQMLIDRVGVQELAGAVAELETGNRDAANGISDAVREIIRDTYEQNHRGFLDRKPELKQARLDRYMENNVSRVTVEDFVKDAWEMYQDGGQTKDEIDRMATREKLREAANTADVQAWIEEKLEGLLGKAGIYNGKDRYTPSGNSRSFAQLHYDYTLENIVRAMNGLQQARGEGIWGASAESFVAVGTPDYRSIDEVRADKGRLREATEEEYDALKAKLDPMIEEIITGVRNSNKAHSDNQFEEIDIIGSLLLDAAKGTKTKAAIRSVFRKNGYTISDALISKAQSLYSEAAKMPTKYFEAKPQRAVSFDEAKAIIVPDNTSAALVQRLEKGGANVISYKAGDEQARLEALNAQEGVKFSDRDSAGRELSAEQAEYFKDSKVRDKDGNLLVMYHGTANGGSFTVFQSGKLSNNTMTSQIGQGFYFTNVKKEAMAYMQNVDIYGRSSKGSSPYLHEVYLDIRSPFRIGVDSLNLDDAKAVYMDGNYDYFFNNWIPFYLNNKKLDGRTLTKTEVQQMSKDERVSLYVDYLARTSSKAVLMDMVRAYTYDGQDLLLQSMKRRLGYDGISQEYGEGKYQYVALSPEQIKNVDNRFPTTDPDIRYSERVTDKKTLDFLNRQKTVKTYKTMQLVDGKLYPPMAARTNGQYEDYSVLGQWEQATEHPELVRDGKYKLDKGKGQGSISAAYNPYMHSSNLVLNDQFSGAYARPNLVTVECEVPVSELTSGYRADGAKDAVGWHAWHTGTVAGQLRAKTGIERQVLLSRWIKPVRILPDAEVAQMYKRLLNGTDIAVPDNVVTPSLLRELRKAGVSIKESGRVTARNAQEGVKFSDRDGNVKDASELTEADFYNLLARVENRELDDRTYIPMRATTPQFFIDVVTEHSGRKIVPQNLPMASQVEHVAQNMEEDDGSSYGAKRPHGLSVEDLVHIAKEMGHPSYIVKQQNGRYAEVVSFYNSRRKKVVVSVDFASNGNNYKYAEYMNGYDGGYYNIIVTQFEPDSLKNYLASNEVVYDKEKMNGRYQVGSGRIVTFTHDTPFIENSLAQNDPTVKRQERDITITPAEILDEINLDAVKGTAAYDALRDYKNALAEREDIRQKLEAQQDLAQNSPAGERVKAKNRADIYQKQFDRADTKVKQLRRNTALRQFVESEMAYVNGRQDALNQADAAQGRYTERFEQRLEEAYQINRTVQERYASMAQQYGTIPVGETPARTVAVPKRTEKGNRVSQTVRTAMEARATTEAGARALKKAVVEGNFSYLPITDKAADSKATETIKDKGYQKALADWTVSMSKGHPGKDAVALGFQLYNQAVNSGDTKTAVQVLTDLASRVREGAQMVQAVRMLKKLSPDNQLYSVQLSLKALQENVDGRYGKKAPKLKLNEALVNNFLEAENEAQKEAAQKAIYRDIASQLPHTFMDRWNSWRYLCMLGNARTHVRNILGNAGFVPVRRMKDAVALGIEAAYSKAKGGNVERSKGFVSPNSDLYKLAKADYENIADLITGGGKYNDAASGIERMKSAFGEKGVWKYLSKIADANSFALDAEDVWFSKPAYAQSLAGYLKANKITAEQFNADEAIRDKARAYAVKEAQRATYRDYNDFSNFIAKVGRTKRGGGTTAKVASTLMEGVLPFRRTPANILVRGVEYSPIGLAQGIYQATRGVKTGKYTAAQAIDRISAGLTGTALVALGALLTAHGILTPPDDDDDKQSGFDKLRGAQSYALKIGKTYATVDWLAPEALPVFVGSQLSKLFSGDSEGGLKALYSALTTISEPMLEMSMLSSLQDVIENVSYADSKLMAILSTAATNYLTQAFPTLAGQIERIAESERETTFATEDSALTKDLQYILAKIMNKTPGEFQQIPYIDAWGRHEDTGTVLARAFNNLLNPAYLSYDKSEPFEDELQRLYDLGYSDMLPQRVKQSQKVEGETLTQEEYVAFAETKGKTQYEALKDIIESSWYEELSDAARGELLGMAYSYADGMAKLEVNENADVSKWILETKAAVEDGGKLSEILRDRLDEDVIDFQTAYPQYADLGDNKIHGYLEYCEPAGVPLDTVYNAAQTCKDFEGEKDSDGKTISGSVKAQVVDYIQGLGLSRDQEKALWDALKGNWKDTDTPWE